MSAGGCETTGRDGFALTEVLVAFAILALVSLAMIRAFAGTTQTIRVTERREAEIELAERLLDHSRAGGRVQPGREEGSEGNLVWWRETTAVEGAGSAAPVGMPRLYRVEISVSPRGKATSRRPLLTSLVLARGADE